MAGEAKRRGTYEERVRVAQAAFKERAIKEEGSWEKVLEQLVTIYWISPRHARHADNLARKMGTTMRQVVKEHHVNNLKESRKGDKETEENIEVPDGKGD